MLGGGVTLLAQRTLFTAEGAVSAENGLDVLDGLPVVRPPGILQQMATGVVALLRLAGIPPRQGRLSEHVSPFSFLVSGAGFWGSRMERSRRSAGRDRGSGAPGRNKTRGIGARTPETSPRNEPQKPESRNV
jgi:hypothetical protein